MKRLFYLISALLLCLGIVFYKQVPTYNPFDDVFDIDTNQLTECDTIIGSCGYVNFQLKTDKRLKVYYQLYDNVVAKGFTYAEDTILVTQRYNYYNIPDSIKNLPINIKEFNKALNKFEYSYLDKITEKDIDIYYTKIRIIHKTNFDTITTSLDWYELENDSTKIVRTISYFNGKPRIFRNANGYLMY